MFSRLFFSKPAPIPANLSTPRTPSPVASIGSTAIPRSPSPGKFLHDDFFQPGHPAVSNVDLLALLKAVPPKTLHSFLISRLSSPSLSHDELSHLSTLLLSHSASGAEPPLVPPARLHCARCHEDFFEVENTPRSCVMHHDDESAEVEFVGHGKKGAGHETTWGCCGQTVDGDGDLGPPPGFCHQGKHTVDRKLARYRHDADDENDRLDSCKKRRCFQKKRGHKRSTTSNETVSIADSVEGSPSKKAKRKARVSDPASISSLSAVSDATGQDKENEDEPQHAKKKRKTGDY